MTKINIAIIAALVAFAMTLDYQIAEEDALIAESFGCSTDSECEGIEL